MVAQMTAVALRRTGHVFGAVTGVTPAAQPEVEQVVGDALPVRFETTVLTVPASLLALAVVPFDAAVFSDPRAKRVVFPDQEDQDPTLESLGTTVQGRCFGQTGSTVRVELTNTTTLRLTEPAPFTLLFQGDSGQPPATVTGQLAANVDDPKSGGLPHTLRSGTTYDVLVLVTGFAPNLQSLAVP